MLIDVHSHIGQVDPGRNEFMDVTNLIAKMDAWGIDKTCILPLSDVVEVGALESGTEDIIAACAHYPDRLIPFCLIDPRFGNTPDRDFSYLLEKYKIRGCKGIGEFTPKLDFDDPRCLNLYRQAGKFNMPVLFHLQDLAYRYGLRDTYGLPRLEHALKICPDTIFIGHGPTFWIEISAEVPDDVRGMTTIGKIKKGGALPRLMRQYPNLWADMSAGSGYNALTRDYSFGLEFLDEFQDKVMFGIDSCKRSDINKIYPDAERMKTLTFGEIYSEKTLLYPNVAYFKELRDAKKLPESVLEKIAWKNCTELLKI